MHAPHCDGHHLHGSRVFITCPSEFRSNILHYNRNLETHTFLFRSQPKAELMMDVLLHYREQMRNILHEFVIMPDHLHLLLTPEADISLKRALQLIKGGFSYRLRKAKRGLVWQESFTNHRIRDEHDYERHAGYIRMNPVRARLVERPEMYPYSSASARFERTFGRRTTNAESRAI